MGKVSLLVGVVAAMCSVGGRSRARWYMGLFSWLFGWKARKVNDAGEMPLPHREDHFLVLPSRQFFGQFSPSPNGRYKIAWSEGYRGDGQDKPSRGRYLLLEGEKEIAQGSIARPWQGAVANNGTFILIDAKNSAGLSGAICAFDDHGRRIFIRHFQANIFSCGISDDGHFAACQTCNSASEEDSSILAVFDLVAGKEIATWVAEAGWPDQYEFSPDGSTIGLGRRGLGTFFYKLSGEFIDREKWREACLTKGDYGTAIMMAETLCKEVGGKISPELAARIIVCIDRITPPLAKADRQWQALALKLHGLCLDASGKLEDALICYDKAFALNAKVGVKRRADQIRKKMARTTD